MSDKATENDSKEQEEAIGQESASGAETGVESKGERKEESGAESGEQQDPAQASASENSSAQDSDVNGKQNEEDAAEDEEDDLSGLSDGEAAQKLSEAEETITRQQNDLLRAQAEMQNLRRRTDQDLEKAHKYGQEKFASELLTVIDNLERALQAAESKDSKDDEAVRALCEGVELTLKSFVDCFHKFNIEQIDPLGEPFDPQLHQAMSVQESPDVEPETVIAVLQKGYTLHGRVIRPAMVMVSKAPSQTIDETA